MEKARHVVDVTKAETEISELREEMRIKCLGSFIFIKDIMDEEELQGVL